MSFLNGPIVIIYISHLAKKHNIKNENKNQHDYPITN